MGFCHAKSSPTASEVKDFSDIKVNHLAVWKQYSDEQMLGAIESVKNGMSKIADK